MGGDPGAGQRRVQGAAHAARSEEALGRPEEAQRRPAGGRPPSQLLRAVQQGEFDARALLSAESEAPAAEAKAKQQTKAYFPLLP